MHYETKMNNKEIVIYVSILAFISVVLYFFSTIGGVKLPNNTIDLCIAVIISISCFHHFIKYEFKIGKSIFQGIIIGLTAGLISGLIIGLMTFDEQTDSMDLFFYMRTIVLLTWVFEAGLTAVIVSLGLRYFMKK